MSTLIIANNLDQNTFHDSSRSLIDKPVFCVETLKPSNHIPKPEENDVKNPKSTSIESGRATPRMKPRDFCDRINKLALSN